MPGQAGNCVNPTKTNPRRELNCRRKRLLFSSFYQAYLGQWDIERDQGDRPGRRDEERKKGREKRRRRREVVIKEWWTQTH